MEKEKLKAIVFDFDGTIADTEGFYADNFFEVMEGYGIHCDAEDRVKTLGYGPDEKVAMMEVSGQTGQSRHCRSFPQNECRSFSGRRLPPDL